MEDKNEIKGLYSNEREFIIKQKENGSVILEFWINKEPITVFSFADLEKFLMRRDFESKDQTDEQFKEKWGISKEIFETVYLKTLEKIRIED